MKESSIKDTKREMRRVAINHLSRREYTKHELLVRLNQRFESQEQVEEVVENTINANVEQPTTGLLVSVQENDLNTVNQHIAYGSDLNIQDDTFSNTPL